jgi:hypothetical protein
MLEQKRIRFLRKSCEIARKEIKGQKILEAKGNLDFRKVLRLCILERMNFQGSNILKSKELAEVN